MSRFRKGLVQRCWLSLLMLASVSTFIILSPIAPPPMNLEHRFVKLNQQGENLLPWQGPWSCIHDRATGLLWENKTDDESIHDGYWTYSWYQQEQGVKNRGDCYFEEQRCDTQDLIEHTNREQLCGMTGWRLPSDDELSGILQPQDRPNAAQLPIDFFQQIRAGDYWSATGSVPLTGHYQHLGQGALAIDFHQGDFHRLPYRNAAFVILVTKQRPKLQ